MIFVGVPGNKQTSRADIWPLTFHCEGLKFYERARHQVGFVMTLLRLLQRYNRMSLLQLEGRIPVHLLPFFCPQALLPRLTQQNQGVVSELVAGYMEKHGGN